MKKSYYWILVVVGLIVFTAVYSLVFPQSQMPVRLTKRGVCASYVPQKGNVYCGNWFIINDKGKRIDLPQTSAKLPDGLRWDKPNLVNYEEDNGIVYATLLDNTYAFDGKSWTKTDKKEASGINIEKSGFEGKRFGSVKNGKIELVDATHNGNVTKYAVNDSVHVDDFNLLRDSEGYSGVQIGSDEYYLTEPSIGRIRWFSNGKETLLDRSYLEAQAVPGDIATDGKFIYAMLSDYGNSRGKFARVQVYDKKLEYVREFAPSRENAVPAAIDCYKSMILLLWSDGLLETYSLDGNLLASWSFGDSGVDLASNDNDLLVVDDTKIELVNITVVKPEMPVWPRIVTLGPIRGTAKTSIVVKSKTQPVVTVKGENIEVDKITIKNGMWQIDISVKTEDLPAFESRNAELALDIDNVHEIVPITFVPYGKVRKIQIFEKFAFDRESGGSISLDKLSDYGKVVKNEYSNQAFILSPNPGEPVGK